MNTCNRCNGCGYEEYEEEGRIFNDPCYHCGTTGYVDDEIMYHDRLFALAKTMAYHSVSEMERIRNLDPEGEDWNFCAAENMMTGTEYFQMHYYDTAEKFMQQLIDISSEERNVLLAWNDYLDTRSFDSNQNSNINISANEPRLESATFNMEVWYENSDDIPF